MKLILTALVLATFSAQASAMEIMSVKERLRLHMWVYGLEQDKQPVKKVKELHKPLPEEIERPLRKI